MKPLWGISIVSETSFTVSILVDQCSLWPSKGSVIYPFRLFTPSVFCEGKNHQKTARPGGVQVKGCPSLNRVANVFVHQLFQLQSTFFLCQLTWQLSTCFSSHGFKECLRNKLRHRVEGSPVFFKHPRLSSLSPPCWLDVICKAFFII